jgi:GMP reductase
MDTVTNVRTASLLAEHNWISVFPKHFNQEWTSTAGEESLSGRPVELPHVLAKTNNYALSCGTSAGDLATMFDTCDHIKNTTGNQVKMVCVDIANGYLDRLVHVTRKIRETMPDIVIMAGNVVTPEGLVELVENGKVDIVKVGIGSGAACTTRLKTGVGYP